MCLCSNECFTSPVIASHTFLHQSNKALSMPMHMITEHLIRKEKSRSKNFKFCNLFIRWTSSIQGHMINFPSYSLDVYPATALTSSYTNLVQTVNNSGYKRCKWHKYHIISTMLALVDRISRFSSSKILPSSNINRSIAKGSQNQPNK